ncbi:MAG TPA: phosphoribosylformimino-5-aminoimidazole carboxamide ribotide isomerase [Chitinispirillaceae bacterium]|nr:phosphoribosylformimino-5-aminoimidazole carboxamide ribotide isomerase [Chitinispirillaceae bacterium]
MKFRPCIDLHNGKVKQIVGSTLRDDNLHLVTNFETEQAPSVFAGMYRRDNLSGGHAIMLGPGNESAALDALKAFPGGLQLGGGINPGNAMTFLDNGASHVIVTSYVFKDGMIQWDNLEQMSATVGKERLVLDLSCKKKDGAYRIVTDRWQVFSEETISPKTFKRLEPYCDEFLIHAADVEGKQGGVDQELLTILAGCTKKPLTYAGGVRSLDDLRLIDTIGNGTIDVTIGSALDIFGGKLSYLDVVNFCSVSSKKQN